MKLHGNCFLRTGNYHWCDGTFEHFQFSNKKTNQKRTSGGGNRTWSWEQILSCFFPENNTSSPAWSLVFIYEGESLGFIEARFLRCYVQRCGSMFCLALVFVCIRWDQKLFNFKREALLHRLIGLGLGWPRRRPDIGQLQGNLRSLQCKEACLHCLSGLDRGWPVSRPDIGQPQGTHKKLLPTEVWLHCLSGLDRGWPLSRLEIGQLNVIWIDCDPKRCFSIVCQGLVFVGPRVDKTSDNFKVPLARCYPKRCGSIVCQAFIEVGP